MVQHPYSNLPDHAFWRRAVESVAPRDIDPVIETPFEITPADRVATAGSCFAQHISRHLSQSGFNYFVTESRHPVMTSQEASDYNFGTFTARYGNIYTARQLRQLFERAYGRFTPVDHVWTGKDGELIDPFRPNIQPGGFACRAEYEADRAKHLAAVRRAFEELDVFVFTLGLTECWQSRIDGATFPLCPGVAGGEFDPQRYQFANLTCDETVAEMGAFLSGLRGVNPAAKVILTVSPVPLIATAVPGQHVLVSTVYSKSVLRVACAEIVRRFADVVYFPSFEIVTGAFARGAYFAADFRSVLPEGVDHVMRVFLKHFAGVAATALPKALPTAATSAQQAEMERLVELNCDELMLDMPGSTPVAPPVAQKRLRRHRRRPAARRAAASG